MELGQKIRELRKRRGMTQEQLADVFAVSFQTISKWENGINTPDISLLPVIAEFFGISMDELFDYKVNSLQYKERFIKFMVDNGVLRFGEYTLKSGRKSPYYINVQRYKNASQIEKLGKFYAECIMRNELDTPILYGNAWNSQALSVATSIALFNHFGKDVEFRFQKSERNEDILIGKELQENDRVTILCDTITSGKTIRNTVAFLKKTYHVQMNNIIVSVDRLEKSNSTKRTSLDELQEELRIPMVAIVTLDDIIRAIENHVIAGNDFYQPMLEYRECYCK